ncbi:Aspartic proteinase A1 isoform 1 [Hibiscus syriacus]|uniref:Aspartic proteinase A1 isoform 1 n=1 Tax=Hibiscus syriacus TaxID=106335 RepID=A0A6A2X7Q7_HIBSY|nr:aspartic proteinase NANA, chloroplast-like [Hibiscus syriacus]KAE8665120.1 Aspartic proteinase A1 isoform 1 [Hibiscus syriacus]
MDTSILFVFLSLSLFFSDSNLCFQVHAFQSNGTARFKLIHRHSPELGNFPGTTLGPPSNRRERLRQLIRSDNARLQTIARRLFPRRKNVQVEMWQNNNLVELPIRSAADIGTGQYFVSFRIGSPPRKFIMIIDTGSSLTWMKCKYKCKGCFKDRVSHNERILNAKTSRTFRPIPCSSHICKQDLARSFSLQHCPRPSAPCSYDYRYSDGTKVLGFFGNDTAIVRLTDGRKVKVPEVMIGCSETIMGEFHDIDGVMGLGFEWHSFALKAARKFGYKFSYCLVDHLSPSNLVNFLVFGDVNDPMTPKLQYTELILGIVNPYYAVNVSGISIDGKMLKIPSHVWDIRSGGGVIVDSGCSLTQLVRPVFDRVVAAFKAPLSKFKKLSIDSEGPDICFDDTGYKESLMPKLVIHFADGAKLTPPVKSYVLDAAEGEKCLGFTATPWPGSTVIGNILQQNHMWEFDLLNSKLGFAPSSCTYE